MSTTKQSKSEEIEMPSLPVTFAQFVKSPVTAMLFLCFFGLSLMIWDMKLVTKRQEDRILFLEQEVRNCHTEIQKLREDNGAMRAEILLRKEYSSTNRIR
jgi:hypothetical protein